MRSWTVALVVLMVAVAGCTDDPVTDDPSTTSAPASTTTSIAVTTTGETIVAVPDGTVLLGDGLAAVGSRYRFASTIEIDGVVVTRVTGRTHDGASAMTVETEGASVDYVKTPAGAWVLGTDGDWVDLEGDVPSSDPIAVLAGPTSVDVVATDGDHVTLVAVYPADRLGVTSATEISVEVTISSGTVVRMSYRAPLGDGQATVTTTLSDFGAVEPVEAPVGS